MQALDSAEYAVVRKKIADLRVTTSVQNLVGYYLPDFQSATSMQSDGNQKYLTNAA